jgi:outer membrane beta-barrel protein
MNVRTLALRRAQIHRRRTMMVAASSIVLAGLAFVCADRAHAQSSTATARQQQQQPQQVVTPEVDRRDVKLPRIASKDFEIGAFLGTYSVQNFGSSMVGGLRLGYHVSEDFFAELGLGQTKVSDDTYRQILPGGIFTDGNATLRYMNLSVGWNVLPGEVFLGKGRAKATSIYLLGGVGSTRFAEQRKQSFNVGVGMRLYLSDRVSMRVDLQDHVYSLDLLGRRETTQNPELSAGLSFYF